MNQNTHSLKPHVSPFTSRICGKNPITGKEFMMISRFLQIIDDNAGLLKTEVLSVEFTGSIPPSDMRANLGKMVRMVAASEEVRQTIISKHQR